MSKYLFRISYWMSLKLSITTLNSDSCSINLYLSASQLMTTLSFQLFIPKIWAPLSKTSSHCSVTKSCLALFLTPWTIARQAPSVHEVSQSRILEWVAISFSRGSSQPRGRTLVSCIGRQILYLWTTTREFQDIPHFQNLYSMWLLITHFRVTFLDMAITVLHLMAAETSSRAFLLLLWFSAHQPLKCKSFSEMEYFLPYQ